MPLGLQPHGWYERRCTSWAHDFSWFRQALSFVGKQALEIVRAELNRLPDEKELKPIVARREFRITNETMVTDWDVSSMPIPDSICNIPDETN